MIGALEVTKILSPASAGAKDDVRRDDTRSPTSPIVPTEGAAEFSFGAFKILGNNTLEDCAADGRNTAVS